jgi:signal transduction histidine kinase
VTVLEAGRRVHRQPQNGLLGGVASGIAAHVGRSAGLIRVLFVVLAFAGGLGIALYGAYWIVLPAQPGAERGRFAGWVEYLIAGVAMVAVFAFTVSGRFGGLFPPTFLACLGGALIWRQATETDRDRLLQLSRTSLSATSAQRIGRVRVVAGAALVIAAAGLVLLNANLNAIRDGMLAVVVAVLGIALLSGPWWVRLMTQLGSERAERIRSQERADIAAHLHDSVLQTLALIQRNADSPREVVRLARGQERELRTLLYGSRDHAGQLGAELRRVAADVEDAYSVSIDVVIVGDAAIDEPLGAACSAAREALVNAAKHSGATAVSLYGEVEADAASIYVKDRGRGFVLADVADDRQGVRGSIIGRVERHGGSVTLRSAPGAGTEVVIRMPLTTQEGQ